MNHNRMGTESVDNDNLGSEGLCDIEICVCAYTIFLTVEVDVLLEGDHVTFLSQLLIKYKNLNFNGGHVIYSGFVTLMSDLSKL